MLEASKPTAWGCRRGPTTARTLERLVGEVRKLPPEVHPVVQALWCQPKCFRAMGDHLRAFEREAALLGGAAPPSDIPIVVISSGRQPAEHLAAHRRLAETSAHGRHVMATASAHWVQFDEPELVIAEVRDLVESVRSQERSSSRVTATEARRAIRDTSDP